MFLNKIKDFFTKKIVKKSLSNVKHSVSTNPIKTIGIVFDESYFYEKESMIEELVAKGIKREDIHFFVFKNRIRKNEIFDYPVFSHKNINWNGSFDSTEVNAFVSTPFDLLISYYDTEKAALLLFTHLSKATFKVGFSNVDNRLNHFMINTNAENYRVFIDELFKYLKILNKL